MPTLSSTDTPDVIVDRATQCADEATVFSRNLNSIVFAGNLPHTGQADATLKAALSAMGVKEGGYLRPMPDTASLIAQATQLKNASCLSNQQAPQIDKVVGCAASTVEAVNALEAELLAKFGSVDKEGNKVAFLKETLAKKYGVKDVDLPSPTLVPQLTNMIAQKTALECIAR